MRIAGKWFPADDGMIRPTVGVVVSHPGFEPEEERFLVDSGADQSVFSADLLRRLRLPTGAPPAGFGLHGISGRASFVVVRATLAFSEDSGRSVTVGGEFAAFTDPRATDLSILGRDVLDNFDVVISRRRGEVLLLASNHQYHVTPA
jgi:hypothetical protein